MRRVTSVVLGALLSVPPISSNSAPSLGRIQGRLTVEGRPVRGLEVSFVDLRSGAIHKTRSGDGGAFGVELLPGDYVVSTGGEAGLAVGRAPARLSVQPGRVATTNLELVALPVLARQEPQVPPTEMQTPPTSGIVHEEVGCFIAGQYPLLEAVIEPMPSVVRARVYFRPARSGDYFYVEMTPEVGRFVGKLPRPRLEASPVTYYIQATTTELGESQTPEITAIVVEDETQCPSDKKVAAIGPPGPVQVFSAATGSIAKPVGFAAGALGLSALTIALLAGGAAAIGIGTAIVVAEPSPSPEPRPSPSPEPSPTPSPEPRPSPSPEPSPTPSPTPTPPTSFSR